MACEFPVAVKAKLMLTVYLLYLLTCMYLLYQLFAEVFWEHADILL